MTSLSDIDFIALQSEIAKKLSRNKLKNSDQCLNATMRILSSLRKAGVLNNNFDTVVNALITLDCIPEVLRKSVLMHKDAWFMQDGYDGPTYNY
jgi:hypothetical protein